MLAHCARTLAAVVGAFFVAQSIASSTGVAAGGVLWMLDLRPLPPGVIVTVTAMIGVLMLIFAASGNARTGIAGGAVLAAGGIANTIRVHILFSSDRFPDHGPVVFSACVAVIGLVITLAATRPRAEPSRVHRLAAVPGTLAFCFAGFPLAQMITFGLTDYRRPADAILVFGARTFADGSPSDALADRVRCAIDLYRSGLAPRVILSGGDGEGAVHETACMRRLLVESGVPESAIIIDEQGLNTRASLVNAASIAREHGITSLLAVSHFYHLPRVKHEAERRGLTLYTVPAPQGRPLRRLPFFMAREIAAWWVYSLSCTITGGAGLSCGPALQATNVA